MCTVTGLQKMLTLKKLTWQTQGNQEKLKLQESKKANVNNGIVLHLKIVFLTFPGDFYTPIFFPIWVIHNCSIFWDLRNLQELLPEIVLNFHCLNKLFKWSQKIWKISDFDLKFQKFFSITRTFFFSVGQKYFGNKTTFLEDVKNDADFAKKTTTFWAYVSVAINFLQKKKKLFKVFCIYLQPWKNFYSLLSRCSKSSVRLDLTFSTEPII